jgi:hypothetical protein
MVVNKFIMLIDPLEWQSVVIITRLWFGGYYFWLLIHHFHVSNHLCVGEIVLYLHYVVVIDFFSRVPFVFLQLLHIIFHNDSHNLIFVVFHPSILYELYLNLSLIH